MGGHGWTHVMLCVGIGRCWWLWFGYGYKFKGKRWALVTTLHDFGGCLGTAFGHFLLGLSQFHGHDSWLVCEVALIKAKKRWNTETQKGEDQSKVALEAQKQLCREGGYININIIHTKCTSPGCSLSPFLHSCSQINNWTLGRCSCGPHVVGCYNCSAIFERSTYKTPLGF